MLGTFYLMTWFPPCAACCHFVFFNAKIKTAIQLKWTICPKYVLINYCSLKTQQDGTNCKYNRRSNLLGISLSQLIHAHILVDIRPIGWTCVLNRFKRNIFVCCHAGSTMKICNVTRRNESPCQNTGHGSHGTFATITSAAVLTQKSHSHNKSLWTWGRTGNFGGSLCHRVYRYISCLSPSKLWRATRPQVF